MAREYDANIIGWFRKNGKRIPIRAKKGERDSFQGKTTQDALNKVEASRGTRPDSADRDYMERNPRVINGEKVTFYGKRSKEEATFNKYSDGGVELRDFKRVASDKTKTKKLAKADLKLESPKESSRWAGLFDVASPQETANLFGKAVETSDGKTVRPKRKSTSTSPFDAAAKRFEEQARANGQDVHHWDTRGRRIKK